MKKVCVIGLGYIGLPTAALLANKNYDVHGVDIVKSTVDIINKGEIHIIEKDLDMFVKRAIDKKKLIASTEPTFSDIFIIAVPTPFKDDHVPNLDYVMSATKSIAPYIKENNLIILESTSPVGTTEKVKDKLEEHGVDVSKVFIAHCPERVLPGNIMNELVKNDRIVGGINNVSTKAATSFYETFVSGNVYTTDSRTAELAKLAENSFRDVNIAFANELSIICDELKIDVWELIKLTNKHPRVDILSPGAGVGGHCIAVDPWFIINASKNNSRLIKTARERNLYKSDWVITKIKESAEEFESKNKRKPNIACMGLSFKPNIDDLRESPALQIVESLIKLNYNILPVEPNIRDHKKLKIYTIKEAMSSADLVVFLVAHDQFKDIDIKSSLDFCGLFNK
jgi:UDP-N-acetyl-D-mannosaminuronic acid dehydrogenase